MQVFRVLTWDMKEYVCTDFYPMGGGAIIELISIEEGKPTSIKLLPALSIKSIDRVALSTSNAK